MTLVTLNAQNVPVTSSLTVAEVFNKQHDDVLRDIKNLLSEAENVLSLPGLRQSGLQNTPTCAETALSEANSALKLRKSAELYSQNTQTCAETSLSEANSALSLLSSQELYSQNTQTCAETALSVVAAPVATQEDATLNLSEHFIETSYVASGGQTYKAYEMTEEGFAFLALGFTGSKALVFKLKFVGTFFKMREELKKANAAEVTRLKDKINLINKFDFEKHYERELNWSAGWKELQAARKEIDKLKAKRNTVAEELRERRIKLAIENDGLSIERAKVAIQLLNASSNFCQRYIDLEHDVNDYLDKKYKHTLGRDVLTKALYIRLARLRHEAARMSSEIAEV